MWLTVPVLALTYISALIPPTQCQPIFGKPPGFGPRAPPVVIVPPGVDPRPRPGGGAPAYNGPGGPVIVPAPQVYRPPRVQTYRPPPPTYRPPPQSYPKFVPRPPSSPYHPPPPVPPFNNPARTADNFVQQAYQKVKDEDNTMKSRLDGGIDKAATDLTEPDPLLFSESPEDARSITHQSRIINWIARLLRGSPFSVNAALRSSAAQQKGIKCPFENPTFCGVGGRYRSIDGRCNNHGHPLWGAAFTPFARILPPEYQTDFLSGRDDGPRERGKFGQLPSARAITKTVHEPDASNPDDSSFSMALTLWGQFLAHDLTDRAPIKGYAESVLKCCEQSGIKTPVGFCFNIPIPLNDVFRQAKGDCLEFARSAETTDIDCKSGVREQLNQGTSFIDGSAIYGAKQSRVTTLRKFAGGLMITSEPNELPILPHGNVAATMRGFAFFAAGDNRVNEYAGLIAMETVWLREHNRIATELAVINPGWSDEVLFQEARHIIIAVVQHISFKEYLPAILGPKLIHHYGLNLLSSGYSNHYDHNVNPSLFNAFATGAFRFGHSMVRTIFSLQTRQYKPGDYDPVKLEDVFFRPQVFLVHEDPIMRGYVADASKNCDRVVSSSLINNLYETVPGSGGDLAAANIQRGRDHGLPSYNTWRKTFGLSEAASFDTSYIGFKDIPSETVELLKKVYKSPEDIDMWTGGVSENSLPNAAVGPLFGNIIGKQFQALKKGDRFWYETAEHPQRFTPGQLNEIRKASMARVLCDTFTFDTIQPQAFFNHNSFTNRRVDCSQIPKIDLTYWQST